MTGDNYDIQSGFGVGPHAHVEIQNQHITNYKFAEGFDYSKLADQLSLLKTEIARQALAQNDANKFKAAAEITEAETAAKAKDGPKITQHLRNIGTWVLTTAKEIGVDVVAEIITKSMGIA